MNRDIAHYSAYGNLDSRVFLAKRRLLAKAYQPMEAQEYMHEIFGNAAMAEPVIATDTKAGALRRYMSRQSAWEAACRDGSIKMAYADFFGPPQVSTLRQLHAFVVDVDHVDAGDLASMMEAVRQQQERLRLYLVPSYIVNSGNGVHLVFALEEPLQTYKRNVPAINTIFDGLKAMFDIQDNFGSFGKVDKGTWLGLPFRMPGTATKFGTLAEAYRCGPKYTIGTLAEFFGVVLQEVSALEAAKSRAPKAPPPPSAGPSTPPSLSRRLSSAPSRKARAFSGQPCTGTWKPRASPCTRTPRTSRSSPSGKRTKSRPSSPPPGSRMHYSSTIARYGMAGLNYTCTIACYNMTQ